MKVVILAGGGGTRLFPMSRSCFPKQFLKLGSDKSLLSQTINRFRGFVPAKDIVIITNVKYRYFVEAELDTCNAAGASIICEPEGRNTAPAIALAVKYCEEKLNADADEVVFVAPSDHVIRPVDKFLDLVEAASEAASTGNIITLGVMPDRPETGYGYINAVQDDASVSYKVLSFREKPDFLTAEGYLAEGGYYWNAGMFVFPISVMKEELAEHAPAISKLSALAYDDMYACFPEMPSISIDYAVMEKSERVRMLPLDIYWNDIGSWDALSGLLGRDKDGNSVTGDSIPIDCENTMIVSNGRLVAGIGLKNINVIETPDAVVIIKKGESQKIKDLVNLLKKERPQIVSDNLTMYRPWGKYTILSEGEGYKVKKIVINPGCKLSLQMHYHRSEHWTVISGTGKLTLDDKEIYFKENESTYIPIATKHRLENPGWLPLSIIEVQIGKYLGEDDIVRYSDDYGRE